MLLEVVTAASFTIHQNSSSIEQNYLEGDVIRGVLNMSFAGQLNQDFTYNLGSSKSRLLDVLKLMNYTAGRDFTCDPLSCNSTYNAYDPEQSKEILLGDDADYYGFRIKNNNPLELVSKLKFTLDVNADMDCVSQVYVDLFNDGTIDFFNTKPYTNVTNSRCYEYEYESGPGYRSGCFNREEAENYVFLEGEPDVYCELMENIPPSGAYEVGGNFRIYKGGGDIGFYLAPVEGECDWIAGGGFGNIPGPLPPAEYLDNFLLETNITYPTFEPFDAFLCVYTSVQYAGDYISLLSEDDGENCGMPSVGPPCFLPSYDYTEDYDLFIKPLGYDVITSVVFDADTYDSFRNRDLAKDLTNYLNVTYGLNCSGETGCIIPVAVWGKPPYEGFDQKIKSVDLKYKPKGSGTLLEDKVYDLTERPAKISSNYLKILAEKLEFAVPDSNGKRTFTLSLGGQEVIEKDIDVEIGFSFNMIPRLALVERETLFTIRSNASIAETIWDFDDGTAIERVTGASVKHAYAQPGEYGIKVTAIKKQTGTGTPQNSTKRFKVLVGNARDSVDLTLKDLEQKISNLELDLTGYPPWVATVLSSTIGLDIKKALVQTKRQEFKTLTNQTDDSVYIAMINALLDIDLPYQIYTSESFTLPGDFGYDYADMSHLQEISQTSIQEVDELKARVFDFMNRYYNVDISADTVTALRDFNEEVNVLKKYKITFPEIEDSGKSPVYLIISQPKSSMYFSSNNESFVSTGLGGGTYLDMSAEQVSSVEFAITGPSAPEIDGLGVYISPSAASFGISNNTVIKECWLGGDICDYAAWSYFWSWTGLGILLAVFLIVYLLLQTWYKRHYEKYLFPNPNDLYNLLNFIYNSRRNNLRDVDVRKSLKQRGWNGEQITYAFRKLEGKRTGMWEIPLFKFAENRKVRKELQQRQGGRPLDTRFIKRPNL
ncbi:MAG: PKD domain-containing protein [Nanoarchaeota archaeon]|nr:PKD domain-containing protein [Nanoarchaeota archaeon]